MLISRKMFNIISYILFLIDVLKTKVEKKLKTWFIFLRICLGEEAYKLKTVLFIFALSLLAATKTLFKRNVKLILPNQSPSMNQLQISNMTENKFLRNWKNVIFPFLFLTQIKKHISNSFVIQLTKILLVHPKY